MIQNTNNTMTRYFIKITFLLNIIVVLILFSYNLNWLINTQVAFFTSLLIIASSYFGYKNNILQRIQSYNFDKNDTDVIDRIDDPFDLYSEDINTNNAQIQKPTIKKLRNSVNNLFYTFSAISSIYRIISYGIFVLGFFYLLNTNKLNIAPYICGLTILPLSILIFMYKQNKRKL